MVASVLVIDDNQEIIDILDYHLSKSGYKVYSALNTAQALQHFASNNISLIILDVMMPDQDGFSLCEKIRRMSRVPILFLTAKSSEADLVKGLLCGGDDYMIKPFSSKELLARVLALLRRSRVNPDNGHDPSLIIIHDLMICKTSNYIMLKDIQVNLTDIEYKILLYLAINRGKTLSTGEIFENVWQDTYIPSSNNTIVVHVKNIRKKFQGIAPEFEYIQTVWGRGYAIH